MYSNDMEKAKMILVSVLCKMEENGERAAIIKKLDTILGKLEALENQVD